MLLLEIGEVFPDAVDGVGVGGAGAGGGGGSVSIEKTNTYQALTVCTHALPLLSPLHAIKSLGPQDNLRRQDFSLFPFSRWVHWDPER